ncbi:MAG: hypothetical protein ACOZF0_09790 [Thermodesulfobacteriota bacterium]
MNLIGNRHTTSIHFGPPQAGAVLVGLIVTMMVLSVLGVAMISQTAVQSQHLAGANLADQAYYLAESGYRYGAAKLRSGDDIGPLNNREFTLGDRGGVFRLRFSTYVFEVRTDAAGSVLETRVPFGIRPGWVSAPGSLVFDDPDLPEAFDSIDMSHADQQIVRFVKAGGSWNALTGQRPKLGLQSNGYNGAGPGGDLNVIGGVSLFPDRNGLFTLSGRSYRYRKADPGNNKLLGITMADAAAPWTAPPGAGTVVLQPFLELSSLGRSSTGIAREIRYSIPLFENTEFLDRFEDKSHWEDTSSLGDHAVVTVDGDKALKVIAVEAGPSPKSSLIAFKPDSSGVNLERGYGAAGRFLSYDAQVKIGFDSAITPEGGFEPIPVPRYFAAGMSFRLDNNSNCYGISFLRGNQNLIPPLDGIDNAIVPVSDVPLIVLWQQTDFGATRNWLAYKRLTPVLFFQDDMESGGGGWSPAAPWARVTSRYHSFSTSWHDSPGGNYLDNQDLSLTSAPIDLGWERDVRLVFWHRYDLEAYYDYGYVEISDDEFVTSDLLAEYTNAFVLLSEVPQNTWVEKVISVPAYYLKKNVRIRFRLVTDGSVRRDGWYIDDVRLESGFHPLQDAVLMVQLREAAALEFTNGISAIPAGAVLTQDGGARGVVLGEPLLSSGAWDGSAAGTILLNRLSESIPFTAGPLKVGGVPLATATGGGLRPKDNYIQVYYGDPDGYGVPDGSLLDMDRHGYPRCQSGCTTLKWPPKDGPVTTPGNDYVTLVQWDAVNNLVGTVDAVPVAAEPDSMLRSHQPELLSPTAGFSAQPELGLHAYGHGAITVYFDDFGLRSDLPGIGGFLPAIQN